MLAGQRHKRTGNLRAECMLRYVDRRIARAAIFLAGEANMYRMITVACLVLCVGCGGGKSPQLAHNAPSNVASANSVRAQYIRYANSPYVLLLDEDYYLPTHAETKDIITGYRGYYYTRQWDCNKIARDMQSYILRRFKTKISAGTNAEGIACFLACYQLPNTKHAILSFITSDKGIVFYDPTHKKFLENITNIYYIGD